MNIVCDSYMSKPCFMKSTVRKIMRQFLLNKLTWRSSAADVLGCRNDHLSVFNCPQPNVVHVNLLLALLTLFHNVVSLLLHFPVRTLN